MWNDAGVDAAAVQALGESMGAPVRLGEIRSLGATPAVEHAGDYATPVALALAGMEAPARRAGRRASRSTSSNSRLAPVPPVRVAQRTLVLGVVGAIVLILAFAAVFQLRSARAEADEMRSAGHRSRPTARRPRRRPSRRWSSPRTWQDTDPRFVQCLHDLTKALPEDGQTFLTSFNLNEELKGGFGGKAKSDLDVLALLDRLNASGRFVDIKAWYDAPRGTVQAAPGPPAAATGGACRRRRAAARFPVPCRRPAPAGRCPGPAARRPARWSIRRQHARRDRWPRWRWPPSAAQLPADPWSSPRARCPRRARAAHSLGGAAARPSRPARGAPSGAGRPGAATGPGGPAPGGPPAGEVTFSMTFNYVPAKK